MTDITEKLRGLEVFFMDGGISPVGFEAAGEIDRLRAEVERLGAGGCARDQTTTQYCAEAARLAAENEKLRAALEWYGEQARLCRLIHSEGDAGRTALADDGGLRARTALQDKNGG